MDIGIYEQEKLSTFLIDIEVVSYKDDLLKKTLSILPWYIAPESTVNVYLRNRGCRFSQSSSIMVSLPEDETAINFGIRDGNE